MGGGQDCKSLVVDTLRLIVCVVAQWQADLVIRSQTLQTRSGLEVELCEPMIYPCTVSEVMEMDMVTQGVDNPSPTFRDFPLKGLLPLKAPTTENEVSSFLAWFCPTEDSVKLLPFPLPYTLFQNQKLTISIQISESKVLRERMSFALKIKTKVSC